MKAWINFLNNLDDYFEVKSENEKWMIILMITVVIGYLSYSFFYPFAESKYKESEHKKNTLQKSIATHKQYLQSISINGDKNFYVKKYKHDIEVLEKNINRKNDNINFIDSSLETLEPLLFNKRSWSIFLNSITREAKAQSVHIDYIENAYVENKGSFGHVLQIQVGCNGSYKNIAKFMNALERSVLITDIYGSHFYLEDNNTKLSADINISVWGVNK